ITSATEWCRLRSCERPNISTPANTSDVLGVPHLHPRWYKEANDRHVLDREVDPAMLAVAHREVMRIDCRPDARRDHESAQATSARRCVLTRNTSARFDGQAQQYAEGRHRATRRQANRRRCRVPDSIYATLGLIIFQLRGRRSRARRAAVAVTFTQGAGP